MRSDHRFDLLAALGAGAALGTRTTIPALAPAVAATLPSTVTPHVGAIATRSAVLALRLFAFGSCVGWRARNADLRRLHRPPAFLISARTASIPARFAGLARFTITRLTRLTRLTGVSGLSRFAGFTRFAVLAAFAASVGARFAA